METFDADAAKIAQRVRDLRIEQEAHRQLAIQHAVGLVDEMSFTSAADLWEEPLAEEQWRVKGLWATGFTALLVAGYKVGKTTMVHNLIKCFTTGEPFLGRTVLPIKEDETICVFDLELDREYLKRELRTAGINDPRIIFYHLRKSPGAIDVLLPEVRTRIANELREKNCKILIIDPMGALLQARGIDENNSTVVGQVLRLFNALKEEAGVDEMMWVHHKGKDGQDSKGGTILNDSGGRGSSAWHDVPDVYWDYIDTDKVRHDGSRTLDCKGRGVKARYEHIYLDMDTSQLYDGAAIKIDINVNTLERANGNRFAQRG